ncbi:MAG TPA: LptA/OstA family protein [Stellaceae bacterium]|nr:LptA/OstA family protein [Stellaceae bacterium]
MRLAPAALAAMLALGAAAAHAQLPFLSGQDGGKPIGIEAENGIEWQQNNHLYIARGNATATRGDGSVSADTLYAFYRPAGPAPADARTSKDGKPAPFTGGSTEIYRIEADGHVRFKTPTQTLTGDHAVYDVDKALLVVTGKRMQLDTPRQTITARDSFEWHDATQTGVARGDAVATQQDRSVRADVLTAIAERDAAGASKISRINANGNVIVSSPGQTARGDAGVYNLDTGIVTLAGHVRLTRGDNELRGRYAVVDLNRNISRLLSAPPDTKVAGGRPPRVEGLLVPRSKPESEKP